MATTRSRRLFARARRSIPGGVNSPVRAFGSVGGTPRFIESGKGCRIIDADGNESGPSPAATEQTPDDPDAGLIDVWYGSYQRFGSPGRPQRWVNVLGSIADPDAVTGLEY